MYYLKTYSEIHCVLVPVGAEEFEASYLRRGAHMFSNTRAYVKVANTHQPYCLRCIVGKSVQLYPFGNVITINELEGNRKIGIDKLIHLLLYFPFLFAVRLVVQHITYLALLSFYVCITLRTITWFSRCSAVCAGGNSSLL